MKNILYLLPFLCLFTTPTFGQSFTELTLLASETNHGGTARIMGFGGANVALGGDISSASSNPAGLGMIRKNQFTLSPSYANNSLDASYFGTEKNNIASSKLSMGNLGIVFVTPAKDLRSDFKGGAFSVSYTQLKNFNETLSYEGNNELNSIVDSYLEQANGQINYLDFEDEVINNAYFDDLGLAYGINLILPVIYLQEVGNPSNQVIDEFTYGATVFEPVKQSETVTRVGVVGEWDFAYGANFKDKIYVGASLGIQTFRFEQERAFAEESIDNSFEFNSLTYNEKLDLRGTGVNLEVGVNYRLTDYVRLGVTATTPTVINVDELYEASMENQFNSRDLLVTGGFSDNSVTYSADTVYSLRSPSYSANTSVLENSYNIRTPYRLELGVAGFLGKFGFISADIEYVGYKSAKLSNSDVQVVNEGFEFDNETIKLIARNTFNFRLGSEFRLKKFRLRAGFSHYASSFKDATFKQGRNFLSGGVGYKRKKWFVDVALVKQLTNEFFYSPYSFASNINTPEAQVSQSLTTATLTLGVNF